jgi:hypothetical protein
MTIKLLVVAALGLLIALSMAFAVNNLARQVIPLLQIIDDTVKIHASLAEFILSTIRKIILLNKRDSV